MTDTEAVRSYPYRDGDVTVLGPEIFASKGGAVISWRGENYVRQQDIEPGREELAAGAMHELASSVRDLASAIRLETADRANPTPTPADTPLRQRIAKAIVRGGGCVDLAAATNAVLAVVQPELRVAAALHRSAETDVTRVIELAERWRQQPDRQDAYLELVAALGYGQPPAPAHNAGPSVAECAAQDNAHWAERQWGGE
jgi:hypothetical protein